jgi:prophage regulatory protein
MADTSRTNNALLRLKQVILETGLARSTIYQRIAAGTFPQQVQLGPKSVGWRVRDIDSFLADPINYRVRTM